MVALQPFNQAQFDACAAYFGWKVRRALTQLDLIKLHVLTDFFHILATGRPVIGGEFLPWKHGPVVRPAYDRVSSWRTHYDEDGKQPRCLQIVGVNEDRCLFKGSGQPDLEEFSKNELIAMDRAVAVYMDLTGPQAVNKFFHDTGSYFGLAWQKARTEHRSIDLLELIDAYDRQFGEDHSDVKTLIS